MRDALLLFLVLVVPLVTPAQILYKNRPARRANSTQFQDSDGPKSSYVHGTIDIIISTKEGFVLATDSRLTGPSGSHRDDGRKLFQIGSHGAAVIAGVIGSEVQMKGFDLRDSIATSLLLTQQFVGQGEISASRIASVFSNAAHGVAGLMDPRQPPTSSAAAAISTVSFDKNGIPEWEAFYVPFRPAECQNGLPVYKAGDPISIGHPAGHELHFFVLPIGYPFTVQRFLEANRPLTDEIAKIGALRLYYERKKLGRLDDFTLDQGVELARALVDLTIRYAPSDAGVGGPIDIATLTPKEFSWISRKSRYASVPPPYAFREYCSEMSNARGVQPLDGLECVGCTFRNMKLSFEGKAPVELIGASFEGSCSFTVLRGARRRKPETVQNILSVMPPSCKIIDQDNNVD